jgi:hypothetical protein
MDLVGNPQSETATTNSPPDFNNPHTCANTASRFTGYCSGALQITTMKFSS